ncbi:hypothetical protein MAR_010706 [Mya arenaria]|uniref:Uncharacterized protein n=1 Tax=Mya arenaria TaxID=6604 RepID=A0ABY7FVB1_MYAAR|nr:hypothetical protein MAR_010706 [Mya arenaria]
MVEVNVISYHLIYSRCTQLRDDGSRGELTDRIIIYSVLYKTCSEFHGIVSKEGIVSSEGNSLDVVSRCKWRELGWELKVQGAGAGVEAVVQGAGAGVGAEGARGGSWGWSCRFKGRELGVQGVVAVGPSTGNWGWELWMQRVNWSCRCKRLELRYGAMDARDGSYRCKGWELGVGAVCARGGSCSRCKHWELGLEAVGSEGNFDEQKRRTCILEPRKLNN